MENVPQLARYDKNRVYSEFLRILSIHGYHISDPKRIVHCPSYGVPQNRKRLVLLASKLGPIELIPPFLSGREAPTVRSAIGNMPPIQDGETCPGDDLHRAQKLSPLNKSRIVGTKEGGCWRDWPMHLRLSCHKRLSDSQFNDVYGRMKWDEPSPTLTTHCTGLSNGRFGHPEQHRAISLREAALLQSFPRTYSFRDSDCKSITNADIQRHIGNAVPVNLGRAIAKTIRKHIANHTR